MRASLVFESAEQWERFNRFAVSAFDDGMRLRRR
jgi:hypothetical protein